MHTASLRDRKHARTRLNLARALQSRLESQSFSAISVKSLCRDVEISEATFFNYFPNKSQLLEYVIQFWLLELNASAVDKTAAGITAIERIFTVFALHCRQRPGFMRAVISWLAEGGRLSEELIPSRLERQLAFPDNVQILEITPRNVDVLFASELEQAMRQAQLPANVLVPTLLVGLVAILFGVPLAVLASDPERIASLYQQQLQIFWAGVRSTAGASQ